MSRILTTYNDPTTLRAYFRRKRNKMFGQMQVTRMFQLSKLETVDEAVAKLLEFAEYPHCFTTNMY
ncbi:MAG: hypothetical protein ABSC21_22570 [Terriglobia bacterium]